MESKVEVKKVDPQGRVILPADWRQSEMKESREIYIIREKGYLKIIPKRKVDLTEYFDKVDLNVEAIENWKKFEKRLYGRRS
jgi:bifunctional DNA-binding transcriptional regulator/antitoxin component of YhaV-PrlF toxin-antitoxin module